MACRYCGADVEHTERCPSTREPMDLRRSAVPTTSWWAEPRTREGFMARHRRELPRLMRAAALDRRAW